MKSSKTSFTVAVALPFVASLGLAFACATPNANAAQLPGQLRDFTPEVSASVWEEDEDQVGSVCLNGHELISFHCPKDSQEAQIKAEELASKIQDLLDDKKFAIDELIPTRSGNQAVIQVQGSPVLSFEVPAQSEETLEKGCRSQALRVSWKFVNEIRTALGAPTLPAEFLRLSERAGGDSARIQKLVSCFSGTASWYGPHFHGRLTSDGHRFDQEKMTAAHRSLPFGTKLLVMNRKTGATCVVEVNDRGPFVGDRVIDLSRGAARQLNMLSDGVAPVACLVIGSTN